MISSELARNLVSAAEIYKCYLDDVGLDDEDIADLKRADAAVEAVKAELLMDKGVE